jgi:hypothetical protein
MNKFLGISLACLLGGIGMVAASPEQLADSEAVCLCRIVNEAEVEATFKKGAYLSLEQLNASSKFKTSLAKKLPGLTITSTDSVTGAAGGDQLSVIASADGKHYRLAVLPEAASKCETAAFSGDDGVIYSGKPVNCAGK